MSPGVQEEVSVPFRVKNWTEQEINDRWELLREGVLLGTPRVGDDLVLWIPNAMAPANLGSIVSFALEEGSGRGFLVRTTQFGERGELFVQLADGVRATAGLPMEGVRP